MDVLPNSLSSLSDSTGGSGSGADADEGGGPQGQLPCEGDRYSTGETGNSSAQTLLS